MIFASFILITALAISAIAAFYSIVGLVAIFAAAAIPIIVMGGALEIGKIATTVWLHQNWQRAPKAFKYYLVPAVAILMFITSMGIFGFLSKAHIEQTSLSTEQRAEIDILSEKVIRSEAKISRWNAELNRLNKGEDVRVDNLVDKDNDALKDIYAQIEREKQLVREDADKQIALQQERLKQAADRKDKDIAAAQLRKEQDTAAIQERYKNSFSKGKMDEEMAVVRETELKAVQTAKENELSVASGAQREIRNINSRKDKKLADIDAKYAPQIKDISARMSKLRDGANVKTENIDARVAELEAFIDKEQLSIDQIREETAVYEREYRKLEAEVGPIKYVAALIYGDDPDINMLERAVRWVIILLVVVFDPLALTLILAATKSFEWARNEKENPTYAHKEYTKNDDDLMNDLFPPQPVVEPREDFDPDSEFIQPDPPKDPEERDARISELEAELAEKNQRIESLVKDLEFALDEYESAKLYDQDDVVELEQEVERLNSRYDELAQQKSEIEKELAILKEQKPEEIIKEVYVEADVDTSMPQDVAELEDTVEGKIKEQKNG